LQDKNSKSGQAQDDLKDYRSVLRHLKKLESKGHISLDKCPFGFALKINYPSKSTEIKKDIGNANKNAQIARSDSGTRIFDGSVPGCGIEQEFGKDTVIKESFKYIDQIAAENINHAGDFAKIISYLNNNAEKNFKHTTKKTRELIKARFNEGFTVEDFVQVVKIKVSQWKDDSKMNRYLRPETLFGTKFESYLNEKIIEENKKYEGPEYKKI